MGCESRACGNVSNFHKFPNRIAFDRHARFHSKDVSLPLALQRAMAQEAEAGREARAKVISAEGEKTASIALRDAANVMAESPAALQVNLSLLFAYSLSVIFDDFYMIYSCVICKLCPALRQKRTRRLFSRYQSNC